MTARTTNPNSQNRSPIEVLCEQMSLVFATYEHAERSQRIKRAMAKRKAVEYEGKRSTNRTH